MPNNNGNGNDLNAVSLGSIDIGNVNNIPPVPPVDSLNSTPVDNLNVGTNNDVNATVQQPVNPVPPVGPVTPVNVEQPMNPGVVPPSDSMSSGAIPPVEPVAPVEPVSYDIPQTINEFNTTPVFNEIGTVPPIPNGPVQTPVMSTEEPKPKKKKNKLIFVIIIVLLIAAVGVGVYIFLNVSNKPAKIGVTPKEVEIEAGGEVSTNIEDYATFTGINSANCSLDTSNVTDTTVVGAEYSFSVTCGANTYNGTVTIVDHTAPVVVLKEVTAQINTTVDPEDFIDSCTDNSECSYEFSDANTVSGYLATAGNYHVDIIVKDAAGNEVTATGTLIVTEDEVPVEPSIYLSCTMNNENLRLGIADGNFTGSATRSYTFTFSDATTYQNFKQTNQNSSSVTYQNVTGTPSFDDATMTLTLTQTLSDSDVSDLPTTYGELRSHYIADGYTCTLEQP